MIDANELQAVQDPNTSAEALAVLSQSENDFVRMRVAAHPNTSAETLVKLSRDENDLSVNS